VSTKRSAINARTATAPRLCRSPVVFREDFKKKLTMGRVGAPIWSNSPAKEGLKCFLVRAGQLVARPRNVDNCFFYVTLTRLERLAMRDFIGEMADALLNLSQAASQNRFPE
jgi:hypothetical protein